MTDEGKTKLLIENLEYTKFVNTIVKWIDTQNGVFASGDYLGLPFNDGCKHAIDNLSKLYNKFQKNNPRLFPELKKFDFDEDVDTTYTNNIIQFPTNKGDEE